MRCIDFQTAPLVWSSAVLAVTNASVLGDVWWNTWSNEPGKADTLLWYFWQCQVRFGFISAATIAFCQTPALAWNKRCFA